MAGELVDATTMMSAGAPGSWRSVGQGQTAVQAAVAPPLRPCQLNAATAASAADMHPLPLLCPVRLHRWSQQAPRRTATHAADAVISSAAPAAPHFGPA